MCWSMESDTVMCLVLKLLMCVPEESDALMIHWKCLCYPFLKGITIL